MAGITGSRLEGIVLDGLKQPALRAYVRIVTVATVQILSGLTEMAIEERLLLCIMTVHADPGN